MAAEKRDSAAQDEAREIVLTRVFDAPRELVFDAFTDPKHVGNWWGPRGFRTTTREINVRPGGVWEFTMHGPDGVDYPNRIEYLEVVRPERLVYLHGGGPDFHVTVTFEDAGGKTKLTMRTLFATAEERAMVVEKYGAIEGGIQHLDRLGEHLLMAAGEPFVITRTFDAPRDLMWRVWTEVEDRKEWFGPKGFPMISANDDFRPGGRFHYALRMPNGGDMWGRWIYRDIVPPERLVFVSGFSDPQGNVGRHPLAPEWPAEMLTIVSFEESGGRTTVTVAWLPINATESERRVFDAGRASMTQGWTGTFEQLEAYLARG